LHKTNLSWDKKTEKKTMEKMHVERGEGGSSKQEGGQKEDEDEEEEELTKKNQGQARKKTREEEGEVPDAKEKTRKGGIFFF